MLFPGSFFIFILLFFVKYVKVFSVNVDFQYSYESLKLKFSAEISETLLQFRGFHNVFTPAYLDVVSASRYAKEVAKAAAVSPLLENSDDVEELITDDILELLLSSEHCNDVNAIAKGIGNILADFTVSRGYLALSVPERVLQSHAGALAGNIIWRLSRLPKNRSFLPYQKDSPADIMHAHARFTHSLMSKIQNSTILFNLCHSDGIDDRTSTILSSAVCGSFFLDFNLSLIKNVSSLMMSSYGAVRQILSPSFNPDMHMMVVSAIVGETLSTFILNEHAIKSDNIEEISHDVSKLVNVGIITNELRMGTTKYGFQDSKPPENIEIIKLNNQERKEIIKTMSDILTDSVIFNNLFSDENILVEKLNAYCETIAKGSLNAIEQSSANRIQRTAESLKKSLSSVLTTDKNASEGAGVNRYADIVSKTLLKVFTKRNYLEFEQSFENILNEFRQIALSVTLLLGNQYDLSSASSDGFTET